MGTADCLSLWAATARTPTFPSLSEPAHADVCIVGAGIAGLSTAYCLSAAGKSVVVLDDGPLAGGTSQLTTAHLSSAIDCRYYEIERLHGEEGARLTAGSHSAAIDRIEEIVRRESIECDFRRLDGYLFLPPNGDRRQLEREWAAARRAELSDVEWADHAPMGSFDTGPCLRFPRQGQFHPLNYLAGVAEAVTRRGGRIFTHSHADEVEGGAPARVRVGKHAVTADAVVVATNSPVNDLVATHTKQYPHMTYAIGAELPRGALSLALYWDTENPYHYVRLQRSTASNGNGSVERDVLIVGGEDHRTGRTDDTQERFGRLERWARQRFPQMGEIEFTWSGEVMETFDGLAFIGRNPLDKDNVFIVTGDCGMGMTHGVIAGMLITDLILGRENPWAKLYDPARKTLGAAGRFAREAINTASQYVDWVTSGDVGSVDQIARDSGAVIRQGLVKAALYRDEQGTTHARSAICPHLGCIVHWNSAVKSWDCPCHGSRFDKFGTVINGPANEDLVPIRD